MFRRFAFALILTASVAPSVRADTERLGEWETLEEAFESVVWTPERLVLSVLREGAPPVEDVGASVARVPDPEIDLIAGGLGGPALTEAEAGQLARRQPEGWLARVLGIDTALPGREGVGPWQLFDGEFSESGCRDPAVASSAGHVAVICRGLDRSAPRAEHLVLLSDRRIERHPSPVLEDTEPTISEDGTRVAAVFDEGGGTLRVLDLVEREDTAVTGAWKSVRTPRLSGRGDTLAFAASLGRLAVVLVLSDGDEEARVAWRSRDAASVDAVADDGGRLLVRGVAADQPSSIFVDVTRGLWTDVGALKGTVLAATLHPTADSAAFVSRVGGVCGLFWTDLTLRRRTDLQGEAGACYTDVDLDDQRRFILFERTDRRSRSVRLHDRRSGRDWMTLPTGCGQAALSGDGYYVAARCSHDPRGRGIYLFAVPQENPAP